MSLVEVIVAVTIVAILAAIVSSALHFGKDRAYQTSDIERLRQIGQAAEIYAQAEGSRPLSCGELVRTGGLDPVLCSGTADRTRYGSSWECVSTQVLPPRVPGFRRSFVGLADLVAGDPFQDPRFARIRTGGGQGWLVDLQPSESRWPHPCVLSGKYHRLLDDGAVVTRQHQVLDPSPDARALYDTALWFYDP